MTENVLVPLDGSSLSHRALRHALREFPDASITALHVVDLFEPGYGAYTPGHDLANIPVAGNPDNAFFPGRSGKEIVVWFVSGCISDFETSYEPLMGSEEWYERASEISDRLFEKARQLADDDREIATASETGDTLGRDSVTCHDTKSVSLALDTPVLRRHELNKSRPSVDPKRIIVEFADEENIDHIVLGAHGRPAEKRPVFGTVAEVVARRATVPVTLVR